MLTAAGKESFHGRTGVVGSNDDGSRERRSMNPQYTVVSLAWDTTAGLNGGGVSRGLKKSQRKKGSYSTDMTSCEGE
jgi:hypothetical protein